MFFHKGRSTPYLPTPGEIRAECRRIRREWSVEERASRRADARHAWRRLIAFDDDGRDRRQNRIDASW
jgi:hypothetical protein